MTILNDEDFLWGFGPGLLLHVFIWTTRVEILAWECADQACESLMMLDMPVSIFYFFLSDGLRMVFSFLLGGLQWGFFGWILYKMIRTIADSIKRRP